MADILGNYFIANIFDDGGDLIEQKTIKWSFTRPKIKTFSWNGGEYLVPNTTMMFKLSPFPYIFNYWICSYENGNPNPIFQSHFHRPIISARAFHNILKEKVLEKMLSVRNKWGDLLTIKNILIFLAVCGLAWYFLGGGSTSEISNTIQAGGR